MKSPRSMWHTRVDGGWCRSRIESTWDLLEPKWREVGWSGEREEGGVDKRE